MKSLKTSQNIPTRSKKLVRLQTKAAVITLLIIIAALLISIVVVEALKVYRLSELERQLNELEQERKYFADLPSRLTPSYTDGGQSPSVDEIVAAEREQLYGYFDDFMFQDTILFHEDVCSSDKRAEHITDKEKLERYKNVRARLNP